MMFNFYFNALNQNWTHVTVNFWINSRNDLITHIDTLSTNTNIQKTSRPDKQLLRTSVSRNTPVQPSPPTPNT